MVSLASEKRKLEPSSLVSKGYLGRTILVVATIVSLFQYDLLLEYIFLLLISLTILETKFCKFAFGLALQLNNRIYWVLNLYKFTVATSIGLLFIYLIQRSRDASFDQQLVHLGLFSAILLTTLYARIRFFENNFSSILRLIEGINISNRNHFFAVMWHLSSFIVSSDTIYITSMEDDLGDYIEESAESIAWMDLWISKIKKGNTVQHAVRIYEHKADFENLVKRCEKYSDQVNYQIGVIFKPPISPLLDIYIVRGKFVAVGYSTNPAQKFAMTDVTILSSPEQVEAYCGIFMQTIWSDVALLKTRIGVSDSLLRDLKSKQRRISAIGDYGVRYSIPSYLLANDELTGVLTNMLMKWRTAFEENSLQTNSAIIKDIKNALIGMGNSLDALRIQKDKSFATLSSAIQENVGSNSRMSAVSNLNNERFWSSEDGEAVEKFEYSMKSSNGKIRRVFVVSNRQSVTNKLRQIVERHRLNLGEDNVRIIDRNDISNLGLNDLEDFSVIDENRVILEVGINFDVYSDRGFVTNQNSKFKKIWNVSSQYLGFPLNINSTSGTSLTGTILTFDIVDSGTIFKKLELKESGSSEKLVVLVEKATESALEKYNLTAENSHISTQGDGSLLVVDNPVLAVRIAKKVYEELIENLETLSSIQIDPMRLRAGISTGKIKLDATLAKVKGIAMLTAKRLETSAESNNILIDTQSFQLLSLEYQTKFTGPKTITGKRNEKIECWSTPIV